jgi:hypothetical protein
MRWKHAAYNSNNITLILVVWPWGVVWIFALLTTCTHHSELQVIPSPLLISTLYRSPQHLLSHFTVCYIFNSQSITMASNSGDSSAPYTHIVNCLVNVPQLNSFTHLPTTSVHSIELINIIGFKITPWHEPHWKHNSSIVAHMFISTGTCLPAIA